jgi:RNA polymerase sigma factor (sigma-70 family)
VSIWDTASSSHQVEHLYCDHHSWLQGWLRKKLGNTFDAADLAQDVFMRLLRKKAAGTEQVLREPRAYLTTIAHGLVVEHWRRRELEQTWLELLATMPEPEVPSPENRLIFLEALISIDLMLASLKPQVRTAFLLAQLEGMTCPQIAERIGKSVATVERYIASALRHCYALRFESA